jgi:hypothetical protein
VPRIVRRLASSKRRLSATLKVCANSTAFEEDSGARGLAPGQSSSVMLQTPAGSGSAVTSSAGWCTRKTHTPQDAAFLFEGKYLPTNKLGRRALTCFCVGDCPAPERQQRCGSQQDGEARPAAHADGCPGLPRLHRWFFTARPQFHGTAHTRPLALPREEIQNDLRRNQTFFYGPNSKYRPIISPKFQRTSAKLCAPENTIIFCVAKVSAHVQCIIQRLFSPASLIK